MAFGSAARGECGTKPIAESRRIADFAFPQRYHPPSHCFKFSGRGHIALDVAGQLWKPVFAARPGHACQFAALVLVPKAPVHLYDGPMPGQGDVRLARQVAPMETEAVAHCMKGLAHEEFGFRVLVPVASHDSRTCRRNGRFFGCHPMSYSYARLRRVWAKSAAPIKGCNPSPPEIVIRLNASQYQ